MKTVFSLLLMFGAFTVGLAAIALVMVVMGFAGAPGAVLYAKARESATRYLGLVLTALGQSVVVAAYAVFVVAVVRWFATTRADAPTWPLWIAAFFHSVAVPTYGMKEAEAKTTAQHQTLGIVALAGLAGFALATFSPAALSPLFSWVPLFHFLLR